MSLVGWWKLDGNAEDSLGQYDGYEQGNPSYSSGKIGDCYDNTGGGSSGIELIRHNEFKQYESYYSFSLWFKSTTTNGGGGARLISRDASEYPTVIVRQDESSPQNFRFYEATETDTSKISTDEWHHMAFTVDAGANESRIFVDGELVGTGGVNGDNSARPYVIGGNTEGDGDISGGHFEGKIDDVRLYDHKLSTKEVRRLSRAKVLHYRFDKQPRGIETDFSDGTLQDWSGSNIYLHTDHYITGGYSIGSDGQGKVSATLSPNGLEGGRRIQSFDYWWWEETSQSGHRITLEDSSGNEVMYSETENPQWILSDGGGEDAVRGYDGQGYKIWTHFEFDFNWSDGTYDYRLSTINGNFVSTGTKDLNSTQDVERLIMHAPTGSGDHNRFDRFNIEYTDEVVDSSGHNNTGIVGSATPEYRDDSKIGSGAYSFDSSNGVTANNDSTLQVTGDLTISFWAKPFDISSPSRQNPVHKDYRDEYTMTMEPDGDLSFYFNDSDSAYNNYQVSNMFQNDNEWVHVTAVRDMSDGEVRWYRNGSLYDTQGLGGGNPVAGGNDVRIGDGYTSPFNGLLDDFRIYAAALSGDEVRKIYRQRGSVDSQGTLHSHEFQETKFDGMIADYTEWTVGTNGSQGSFGRNGSASENEIIEMTDPFGREVPVWKCIPDGSSGADGGWNMDFQGDNSDRLRMSVLVKRTGSSMNGSYYHGCDNTGNTERLDGSTDGNPYFHSGNLPSNNTWYLLVGILHPHSYTGGQSGVSGVYDMDGNKVSGGTDYRWGAGSDQRLRNYLYYSTDTSERQYFVYPRVDVMDGTEPDIDALVNGIDSRNYNYIQNIDASQAQPMSIQPDKTFVSELNEKGPGSNSLVGHWRLDGDTRDYSGNGNHGTNNGASVTSGLGQSSYDFQRSNNDYIDVGTVGSDFAVGRGDFTFSAWVKFDSFPTNGTIFELSRYTDALLVRPDNGDWTIYMDNDANDRYFENPISASTGEWVHFLITRRDGTVEMYEDAQSLGTNSMNGRFDINQESYIGMSVHSAGQAHDGKLQDMRFHNRALTDEEIRILYNLTDPRRGQRVIQSSNGAVFTKGEFNETL